MAKAKDEIIFDEYVHSQAIFNRYDFASPENFADQLEYIVEELEKEILKSGNKKKADRLKKLKSQANKELENVYKVLEKDLTDEMENSSKYAYESTNKAFNVAFDIKAPSFEALPATAINIFTSLSEKVYLNDGDKQRFFKPNREINKLLKDHKKEYVRAINKSLAFGLGAKESAKAFKDSAQNINGVKNRHIDSLVRTTIADSMSRAREYSEDKNFSDVIKGYQHISVMDNRTSSICAFRAGMIKKNREDFDGVPPLHFRCRSMLVTITSLTDTKTLDTTTRTWDEEIYADRQGEIHTRFKLASDKDIKIKVPSQKSKFNSFDIAFQSWSKERQIQYLGPQKYKLYKDGKISIKSLLDGSGRIRTVKELAKLSGLNMEELKEIRKRDIKAYKPKITNTAKKVFEERSK